MTGGNWTSLETADGPMQLYEASPSGDARGAVIVIQEAFGVNEHIQQVTDRVAAAGYHAVAPAIFHRAGDGVAEYGDFDAVMKLLDGMSDEGILIDVDATLDHLRSQGFTDDQVGLVGFCMGGRISFLVAAQRSIGASVGYYGGGIATKGRLPFPALIDHAPTLQTPWYGIFGDEDASIPIDDVEALRKALEASPVAAGVRRYAGAGHGFNCDARPDFHPAASADAWPRTLGWFATHLG